MGETHLYSGCRYISVRSYLAVLSEKGGCLLPPTLCQVSNNFSALFTAADVDALRSEGSAPLMSKGKVSQMKYFVRFQITCQLEQGLGHQIDIDPCIPHIPGSLLCFPERIKINDGVVIFVLRLFLVISAGRDSVPGGERPNPKDKKFKLYIFTTVHFTIIKLCQFLCLIMLNLMAYNFGENVS